jgi:hypothetical protein
MLCVMTEMAYPKNLRGHPDTSTIFVLGLLGLLGGVIFGPCAWYFGNRLLDKYDAEPHRWGARKWAQAGVTMGKIGTFLIPVWVIVIALVS